MKRKLPTTCSSSENQEFTEKPAKIDKPITFCSNLVADPCYRCKFNDRDDPVFCPNRYSRQCKSVFNLHCYVHAVLQEKLFCLCCEAVLT